MCFSDLKASVSDLSLSEADKDAAWALYVELLIFVTLTPELDFSSKYTVDAYGEPFVDRTKALCMTVGKLLMTYGRTCLGFSRIAGVFFRITRPFLADRSRGDYEASKCSWSAFHAALLAYTKWLGDEVLGVEVEMRCEA